MVSLGRPALLVGLLATAGCTTLGTLRGARTLDPGQDALQLSGSLQAGSSAMSLGLGAFPLPQLELAYRHGLAEDVDVGFRTWLFGASADVRYRFWRKERVHVAVSPSLGGAVLPVPDFVLGNVDLDLPLLVDVEVSRRSTLTLAPRTLARQNYALVAVPGMEPGRTGRYELLAGGGARYELRLDPLRLGVFGDLLRNTTRGGPPWWTAGVDVGFVTRGRTDEEAAE